MSGACLCVRELCQGLIYVSENCFRAYILAICHSGWMSSIRVNVYTAGLSEATVVYMWKWCEDWQMH